MRRRVLWLAFVAFPGCGISPREEGPVLEPPGSGGALYVVGAEDDFLDDGSRLYVPFEPEGRAAWLGEQAFRLMLRAVARGAASVARTERFSLREGETVRLGADRPVHYLVPEVEGRFALREHGRRAGFEVDLSCARAQEAGYLRIEYRVDWVLPARKKIEGTELEAGEPRFEREWVDSGSRLIPARSAVVFGVNREGSRAWFLFLFVASVEPARK